MLIGYARGSTRDQSPALQLEALREVGCERVFTEKASGAPRNRPELKAALDYIREGDTLVVWKLDRLARSVRQLVETAAGLKRRGIGLKVLTQQIDTTTSGGRLPRVRRRRRVRARADAGAGTRWPGRGECAWPPRRP